jgi:DNA-binding IclR family transcriptional regulator
VPTHADHAASRYQIRSVQRALTLLRTFLAHDSELSASQLSQETGLDPSTVFRLLVTLEAQGFVEVDRRTGRYRPGVVLLELGSRFLKNNDIRSRSIVYLEQLRDRFGETVHLTVLDGNEVVYLEKLAGLHPIGFMSSRVGDRNPAHCTGVGKALLAYLPDEELSHRYPSGRLRRYTAHTITDLKALRAELKTVRSLGYAVDREEHEEGVRCVAVPTFDHQGIAAAISVSGPTDRMDDHLAKDDLVDALRDVARQVSEGMGWGRGVDQLSEARARPKSSAENNRAGCSSAGRRRRAT